MVEDYFLYIFYETKPIIYIIPQYAVKSRQDLKITVCNTLTKLPVNNKGICSC